MSWLSDIFGGGGSSGGASATDPFNYGDMTSGGGFGNTTTDPSSLFSGFGNLPPLQQHDQNPTSTPGNFDNFDFGDSFGFMPSSFTQPESNTPSLIMQPNNLGGAAAMPQFNTGMDLGQQSQSSALSGGNAPPGGGADTTFGGGAAPPAAASKPSDSILDLLGLGTGNGGLDNKLFGAGVSGLGLAANLMMGSGTGNAQKKLNEIAGGQNAQGQQLQSYLANGTLPPGAQQWVDQQTAAQKAAIRAKHSSNGTQGSSMEVQELNQVDQAATAQMFTIASQLLNTGISETGASGTLYNYLMQQENQDSKEMSDALQNFVSSLAGGGSRGQSITLKAS